ncbi:hypothetical protein TNCV_3568831 [Trichonephila clavipes]|nr:hypothetical protein TNCV_3568831 [Trichonephila clavipes]
MVQNKAVDDAILNVTEAIRNADHAAIPKTSNSNRKLWKPGENLGSSMRLQSHRQLPANSYGERSKQRMAFIGNLTFRYWKNLLLCIRHLLMWPT